jgi:F-type H+-transporting ATPase subunit b
MSTNKPSDLAAALRAPRVRLLVAAFVACALAATVAQASGAAHKSEGEVVRETLWQAFNLIVIVVLLVYFGRKPVSDYFAARRQGIQTQLSQAAELLTQAEHRNSELQRRLVDLSAELDSIRESSSRRAEEEALRILAEARATADRIRRDAQAAVDQELRRAQAKLREEAADLALELAASKLQSGVTEADRDRLVDEFITRVQPNPAGGVAR